ncbi:zinc ribbon domain-containing protein [Infirmifilum uzonense]|nr:zinc ribbon domain-containing protein [Infirmifilum uzonense]
MEKKFGYRVWKISASKEVRTKLLGFRCSFLNEPKDNLKKYWQAWQKAFEEAREKSKKRTRFKSPPLFLPVRFQLGGVVRGNHNAPVVIDLRSQGELRISRAGIRFPLKPSLTRALREENSLTPRPEFIAQITSQGRLRIIAFRRPRAELRLPIRVIGVDINSRHGITVVSLDIEATGARLVSRLRLKPPNHGWRKRLTSELQRHADTGRGEVPLALPFVLTTERAGRLARKMRHREKGLNAAFVQHVLALLRRLIREAVGRGYSVLVAMDPINPETLRGTGLQGTLLRVVRRVENLALYEGVALALFGRNGNGVSGKLCPLCGGKGVEVAPRRYQCPHCHIEWNRDYNASFRAILLVLQKRAPESAEALRRWLQEHPRALL